MSEKTIVNQGSFEVFPTLIKAASMNYAMNKVLLEMLLELSEKLGSKPFDENSKEVSEKIEKYKKEFYDTFSQ